MPGLAPSSSFRSEAYRELSNAVVFQRQRRYPGWQRNLFHRQTPLGYGTRCWTSQMWVLRQRQLGTATLIESNPYRLTDSKASSRSTLLALETLQHPCNKTSRDHPWPSESVDDQSKPHWKPRIHSAHQIQTALKKRNVNCITKATTPVKHHQHCYGHK